MRMHAVSVWKTTSRLDKNSNKDGQPTFNCLLLQFGVVAQGVQELADLMHEVENQPATTILQVCSACAQPANLYSLFLTALQLCDSLPLPDHDMCNTYCHACRAAPACQHSRLKTTAEYVLCMAVCFTVPCLMSRLVIWKHEQTIAISTQALLERAYRLAHIATASANCRHKWFYH